jgi:hypothetical protein
MYLLDLSAKFAGKWGAVFVERTAETTASSAGMAVQDARTVVAHSSHLILLRGKACSVVERREDK